MIKYLGSKRVLAPALSRAVAALPVTTVCDLFAGTTRIGQELRRSGVTVHSNDTATYSEVLGQAYIAAGPETDRARVREVIAHLMSIPGHDGYFTETFCQRARYVQPHNGRRIDAMRDEIDRIALSPVERGLVLTSLLEAADRVDSTCGLQMAFVKQWSPRSHRDIALREPEPVAGPSGTVTRLDANALAPTLDGVELAYLDPPYNQHSYFSNYHVWETLLRWDAPETYGIACKRVDCQTTKSPYNGRRSAWPALAALVENLRVPWLVVSFSNDGYHDLDELQALLGEGRHVGRVDVDFPRYIGARIGIHNGRGEKVGSVGRLRNSETLFIAGPDAALVRRAAAAATAATGATGATTTGSGPAAGRGRSARRSGSPAAAGIRPAPG